MHVVRVCVDCSAPVHVAVGKFGVTMDQSVNAFTSKLLQTLGVEVLPVGGEQTVFFEKVVVK